MAESEPTGLRLLVLDGGDIRCLSQLSILEEFLHQVQWTRKSEEILLPCDYFHMICATGPAGMIVIFLVIFRMSIQEAKDEFVRIWMAVFANDSYKPEERSSRLETIVGDLLKQRNMPLDRKLLHNTETCKTFVCAILSAAPTTCQKLRTYRSSQRHIDVSIIEAIRATCATPGRFTSVKVSSPRRDGVPLTKAKSTLKSNHDAQEFIAGDKILQNPTREAIKELYEVYGSKQWVSCVLSLGCGRPGVLHIENLKDHPEDGPFLTAILQSERVADELDAQLGGSQVYYRFSVDQGLESPNSISEMRLDILETHTLTYLQQATTNNALNSCVAGAEVPGRKTTKDIFCVKTSTPPKVYGLPPLCTSFVIRQGLLNSMDCALFKSEQDSRRIMVLSGMGGSGKTQMVAHFAKVYSFRFQFALFVDASTKQKIEQGLRAAIRFIGEPCESVDDALDFLDHPDRSDNPYLLIFDNADDPRLELAPFLPRRGYGYIVITTRNPTHGDLAPKSHIRVDVMSETEALDVLLLTAFSSRSSLRSEDRQNALDVIQELGRLPVAIVQAGSYIKHQSRGRIDDYLMKLRSHRDKLFSIPAKSQLDCHHHAVYSTLDITLDALSTPAKDMLGILACFNYTAFPLPLIDRATSRKFLYDPFELFDRPPEFQETAQFLADIFTPADLRDIDVLAELEQFSLVTRVENYSMSTLRFHPLTHAWMSNRISVQNEKKYWNAATRLLVCGTSEEDEDLFEYLQPQLASLSFTWDKAHRNDMAAIARLILWGGDRNAAIATWENLDHIVTQLYGAGHLRSTVPKLQLVLAYDATSSWSLKQAALKMIDGVIAVRSRAFTPHHPYTLEAINTLSEVITLLQIPISDYNLARQLDVVESLQQNTTLELRLLTLKSQEVLAKMYQSRWQWPKAGTLLLDVIQTRMKLQGPYHWMTLRSKQLLAYLYSLQHKGMSTYPLPGGMSKAISPVEELQRELVIDLIKFQGPRHSKTLEAQQLLGELYERASQHDLAADIRRQVVEGYKATRSPHDEILLDCMEQLVNSLENSGQLDEAIMQRQEIMGTYKAKGDNRRVVEDMGLLAKLLERRGRNNDAVACWEHVIGEHKANSDNRDAIQAIESLAELLEKNGRHDDAVARMEQVIEGWKVEGDNWQARQAMESLAELFEKMGRHDDAVARMEQVIEGWKVEGDNWQARQAMESLAKLLERVGWHDEAVARWEGFIEHLKTAGNNQEAFEPMGLLVGLLERLGRSEDAAVIRQMQIMVELKVKGDNRQVVQAMESLVKRLQEMGRHDEAVALWEQWIGERKAAGDYEEALQAIKSLSELLENIGRLDDAVSRWEQVIGEWETKCYNNKAFEAMESLAELLERVGRRDDAVARWEKCIEGQKLKHNNWVVWQATRSLAKLLGRMGRHDDAVARYEQVIGGWKAVGNYEEILQSMKLLCNLLEKFGRHDDAASRWEQVIAEWKAKGFNMMAIKAMESLAELFERAGWYGDAVAQWEQVIWDSKTEGDNWQVIQAIESLAMLFERLERYDDAMAQWVQVTDEWNKSGGDWQTYQRMQGLEKPEGGEAEVSWERVLDGLEEVGEENEVEVEDEIEDEADDEDDDEDEDIANLLLSSRLAPEQ